MVANMCRYARKRDNRDRSGIGDQEPLDTAVSFFRRLGEMAGEKGVSVFLEPNPPALWRDLTSHLTDLNICANPKRAEFVSHG
jgi:hypothetical protein